LSHCAPIHKLSFQKCETRCPALPIKLQLKLCAGALAKPPVKQIIAVIAGIPAFIGGAVVARDVEKYRAGLLLLVHAQRRGGLFLEQTIAAGGRTQVSKLGIEGVVHRWRELAKMSDAELERSLQWYSKRGLPREPEQRQKQ
jgi:hypothetical protein